MQPQANQRGGMGTRSRVEEERRRLESVQINTRRVPVAAWALCVRLEITNAHSHCRISSQAEEEEDQPVIALRPVTLRRLALVRLPSLPAHHSALVFTTSHPLQPLSEHPRS